MKNLFAVCASLMISATSVSEALSQNSNNETIWKPIDQISRDDDTTADPYRPKIVGGDPAELGEFPFQVALIASWVDEGKEFDGLFCGGSLIRNNWVLTAAHCVNRTEPTDIDVIVGGLDFAQEEASRLRLSVDAVFVYPDYDTRTSDNDIALLKLIGPAPDDLATLNLPSEDWRNSVLAASGKLTVIGWGNTEEGGQLSQRLQKVDVSLQPSDTCEQNYRQVIPHLDITENMFCAGESRGGVDSCQGDSGGFIGAKNESGDFIQYGVVSFGVGCARPGLFGVYAEVDNYLDWINDRIGPVNN